ncbi:MAG: hypothetical protein JOS17DRAFT_311886 [Linnemannia elongata]|nr:MAG: hypothetical protein JOS17DRAFT_311886 [Linnemannia elongata]
MISVVEYFFFCLFCSMVVTLFVVSVFVCCVCTHLCLVHCLCVPAWIGLTFLTDRQADESVVQSIKSVVVVCVLCAICICVGALSLSFLSFSFRFSLLLCLSVVILPAAPPNKQTFFFLFFFLPLFSFPLPLSFFSPFPFPFSLPSSFSLSISLLIARPVRPLVIPPSFDFLLTRPNSFLSLSPCHPTVCS